MFNLFKKKPKLKDVITGIESIKSKLDKTDSLIFAIASDFLYDIQNQSVSSKDKRITILKSIDKKDFKKFESFLKINTCFDENCNRDIEALKLIGKVFI